VRGLDYLRLTPAIDDARLDDAIALLRQRGRKPGGESRWNTLRALPVLPRRDGVA
jgi:hypothetical protein